MLYAKVLKYALGIALLAAVVACTQKPPAPVVIEDAITWQQGGFLAGQINGFTRDSVRVNENFSYRWFLDPFQTHYVVDTIAPNGVKRPLYIFDLSRFDPATGANMQLSFALDSLGGKVREVSPFYPQRATIQFVTPGLKGELITYQTSQTGTRGVDDKRILVSQVIYNEEVNRLVGFFSFKERLGMRDTTVLFGPEVRGSFDMFVKRKLR